ncbi:nicotinate-nicotinamide nucleotide adenylyltransferase [Vibrio sp. 10N.286.49.B3]|uniref:nicotinate-nicotinamide nucleotide adenylyltransferase n=1 Tax=Vibrio sp. 10N.286.49.B3 TaxID=1880855 RepID=UPI000C84FBCC|nr:nicotinate-nicotinamide nucleotide adenylyltransferase [Vibrio sp. 10N.286.49.B3]PMH43183.1 nicotinate-nicotinamide nucleotide adenylyltransferase [Vibrio sp. 10N.286.49.B3]
MKKIAIFGSAFNPPSRGHQSVIESLSHFDLVLLEPSIAHAWGKEMLDYTIRCQLVDEFVEDLGLGNIQRSTLEQELHIPGQSVTTFAVLEKAQAIYPDCDITFVVGPDNFFNFAKFYNAQQIMQRWSVIAMPEKVNIRSTDIRNAISRGECTASLTTPRVTKMLQRNDLYKIINNH